MNDNVKLPPGQQLVGPGKWPYVGERESLPPLDPWPLEITDGHQTLGRWTLAELQNFPTAGLTIDIHCVTRWSKLGVRFQGVRLASLLEWIALPASCGFVSFVAHTQRQHSSSLPLEDALALDTLLAWEVDEHPLPAAHGGPLRAIVPGRYFYKSVKWVTRIDLLDQDRLGYWESDAGYHNQADPWQEQRYLAPNLDRRQARELLSGKKFDDRDLRGLRAQNMDLSDLSAVGALLRDAHFENATLTRANFQRANLSNAHFNGANLQQADFSNADLEGADFTGADLRQINWSGASLFGASFVSQDGKGATRMDPGVLTQTQIAALTDRQIQWIRNLD